LWNPKVRFRFSKNLRGATNPCSEAQVQSTLPNPFFFFRIDFNIILPFRRHWLFFPFRFSYTTLCAFPSHPRYGLRPATFRRSDNPDNIWLAVQIVKFLIALFCLAICYFVLPSLNPFVLSTQFSSILCTFHIHTKQQEGYSFTYFNFFSTADGNTKYFEKVCSKNLPNGSSSRYLQQCNFDI
jgi:hypothetical protein